jgi:hypothetical protein
LNTFNTVNTERRRRKGYAEDAKKIKEKMQKDRNGFNQNSSCIFLFGIPSA